ncbi:MULTISPECIES: hypothetical protein [unclassified Aminobacter]|jgi:hypothetical protein|uniref:hypothetical protein n=1 Tax=unclassified Aminobacter TaxID=2644704 RepID=UPI0004AF09B6|nr:MULTISPECIES: hypothetical protein [unclassified Aminobacter]TWG65825.1 hypothetical protein L610_001200000180 [Aminobacter sp. J44]TWH32287.1 hypothetical protein L611_002000000170 [Aminobacter sp. J15]
MFRVLLSLVVLVLAVVAAATGISSIGFVPTLTLAAICFTAIMFVILIRITMA